MEKRVQEFAIIRLFPDAISYYPASVTIPPILQHERFFKHTEMAVPLGHSRCGGPIVDLPPDVAYPNGLFFAAQLDLAAIAPYDVAGLLPKTGQLLFFTEVYEETGKVFYADVPNHSLVRTIKEHDESFYDGCLIKGFSNEVETLQERFDPSLVEEEGDTGWDYFAGSKKSKLFGIYTHCQLAQAEVEAITFSSKILLLQIGEDFTEEGVLSVLIEQEDLKNRNFANCEFAWGQS